MALQYNLYRLEIFDWDQSRADLHAEEVMSLFGPGSPVITSTISCPSGKTII